MVGIESTAYVTERLIEAGTLQGRPDLSELCFICVGDCITVFWLLLLPVQSPLPRKKPPVYMKDRGVTAEARVQSERGLSWRGA